MMGRLYLRPSIYVTLDEMLVKDYYFGSCL